MLISNIFSNISRKMIAIICVPTLNFIRHLLLLLFEELTRRKFKHNFTKVLRSKQLKVQFTGLSIKLSNAAILFLGNVAVQTLLKIESQNNFHLECVFFFPLRAIMVLAQYCSMVSYHWGDYNERSMSHVKQRKSLLC